MRTATTFVERSIYQKKFVKRKADGSKQVRNESSPRENNGDPVPPPVVAWPNTLWNYRGRLPHEDMEHPNLFAEDPGYIRENLFANAVSGIDPSIEKSGGGGLGGAATGTMTTNRKNEKRVDAD